MKQISLLLSALFVIGCAQERYVVIPDESGQSGSLLVKPGERVSRTRSSLRLVNVRILGHREAFGRGPGGQGNLARPAGCPSNRREKFTVYFLEGTNDLTPESTKTLEAVFEEIRKRTVADVVVIGHTDTVGAGELNDRLAETRAKPCRQNWCALALIPSRSRQVAVASAT